MAAIGAQLPALQASLSGECCPTPAVRNTRRDRLSWVGSDHSIDGTQSSQAASALMARTIIDTQIAVLYLSSQTSSMRQPLKTLLTMIVNPFT